MKRRQPTIQEMLKKRKGNEEASSDEDQDYDRIKVIPYLMNANDLTQESAYPVSTMAKVYFREHSNINEILDLYLKRENIKNAVKEDYLSSMIRHVISYLKVRRDYPLNMFKFESDYHECIGKFLLQNHDIKSNEDLQATTFFMVQNSLKHCQVSMDLNNKFRSDEQEFLNRKIQKVGYPNLKPFLRIASDHALRLYNLEHNLLEKYNLDEITLEEMCKISTIQLMTKRDMEKKKIPQDSYNDCLGSVFAALKSKRGLAITLEGFYVYPKYVLIINNLTVEQERIITERMDRFYNYTNAKGLLAIYKKYLPVNIESDDPVIIRKERRRQFYLKYIRLIDKKQIPFNNLLWIKKEKPISQNNTINNQSENVAGPSNASVWRKKPVTEKNDTTQSNQKNDTVQVDGRTLHKNNTAQINALSETEKIVPEHQSESVAGLSNASVSRKKSIIKKNDTAQIDARSETEPFVTARISLARNPKDFLSAQISGSKYKDIIVFLIKQNEFVEEIRKCVQNSFPAGMWEKNSKLILWNCIHINLEDRNEHFLNLLKTCSISNRELLDYMLSKVDINVNDILSIGEPIATSTQTMNNSLDSESSPIQDNQQNRPFQSCSNSQDIVDINNKTLECPIQKVKEEKLSEQFVSDSEVQCVPLDVTDVVTISDDESSIPDKQIEPENNGIDVYQQNLNMESQVNHDSDDINASLEAEYGLITHRNTMPNVTNKRNLRQQKKQPTKLVYDSNATSLNNNARN